MHLKVNVLYVFYSFLKMGYYLSDPLPSQATINVEQRHKPALKRQICLIHQIRHGAPMDYINKKFTITYIICKICSRIEIKY